MGLKVASEVFGYFLYEFPFAEKFFGDNSKEGIDRYGKYHADHSAYFACHKYDKEYFQGVGFDAFGVYERLKDEVVDQFYYSEDGDEFDDYGKDIQ